MTSSVERTDLDFKISVALRDTVNQISVLLDYQILALRILIHTTAVISALFYSYIYPS